MTNKEFLIDLSTPKGLKSSERVSSTPIPNNNNNNNNNSFNGTNNLFNTLHPDMTPNLVRALSSSFNPQNQKNQNNQNSPLRNKSPQHNPQRNQSPHRQHTPHPDQKYHDLKHYKSIHLSNIKENHTHPNSSSHNNNASHLFNNTLSQHSPSPSLFSMSPLFAKKSGTKQNQPIQPNQQLGFPGLPTSLNTNENVEPILSQPQPTSSATPTSKPTFKTTPDSKFPLPLPSSSSAESESHKLENVIATTPTRSRKRPATSTPLRSSKFPIFGSAFPGSGSGNSGSGFGSKPGYSSLATNSAFGSKSGSNLSQQQQQQQHLSTNKKQKFGQQKESASLANPLGSSLHPQLALQNPSLSPKKGSHQRSPPSKASSSSTITTLSPNKPSLSLYSSDLVQSPSKLFGNVVINTAVNSPVVATEMAMAKPVANPVAATEFFLRTEMPLNDDTVTIQRISLESVVEPTTTNNAITNANNVIANPITISNNTNNVDEDVIQVDEIKENAVQEEEEKEEEEEEEEVIDVEREFERVSTSKIAIKTDSRPLSSASSAMSASGLSAVSSSAHNFVEEMKRRRVSIGGTIVFGESEEYSSYNNNDSDEEDEAQFEGEEEEAGFSGDGKKRGRKRGKGRRGGRKSWRRDSFTTFSGEFQGAVDEDGIVEGTNARLAGTETNGGGISQLNGSLGLRSGGLREGSGIGLKDGETKMMTESDDETNMSMVFFKVLQQQEKDNHKGAEKEKGLEKEAEDEEEKGEKTGVDDEEEKEQFKQSRPQQENDGSIKLSIHDQEEMERVHEYLTSEVKRLEAQAVDKHGESLRALEANERLKEQLEQLESEKKERAEGLDAQIDTYKQKISGLEHEIKCLNHQIDGLNAHVERVVGEKTAELSKQDEAHQQRFNKVNFENERLVAEIGDLTVKNSDLTMKNDKLATEVTTLTTQLETQAETHRHDMIEAQRRCVLEAEVQSLTCRQQLDLALFNDLRQREESFKLREQEQQELARQERDLVQAYSRFVCAEDAAVLSAEVMFLEMERFSLV